MSALSPREIAFALFSSRSRAQAAEALGISRATLYRRLRHPAVQREIDRLLECARATTAVAVSEAIEDAISTLREIATNSDMKPEVRIAASVEILRHLRAAQAQHVIFEE
jgi:hypothetical protein